MMLSHSELLKPVDDEHKKYLKLSSTMKNMVMTNQWSKFANCMNSYTANRNIQKRAGVPSTDEDVSTE